MSNKIKMSTVSIPESDYMQIKKSMKENNERNFIDYLRRQVSKLQDTTLRLLELTETHKNLEEKLKNSIEHNHFLASELGKTSSELRESRKKYSTLESNLEVVIRDDNNHIKDLENKLLFGIEELAERNAEINSLSEKVSDLEILLSEKNNEVVEYIEHEQALYCKLEQVNNENRNLKEIKRVNETRIEELKEELESLRTFKGRIKNLFSK